jgi:hypothetical protein
MLTVGGGVAVGAGRAAAGGALQVGARGAATTGAKRVRALCSFSGSTAVLMADGSKKTIEEVEVGDEVIATDPVTGEQGAKNVTHVWVHQDDLFEFEVDGELIVTTEDHPFWSVTDQVWQGAQEFHRGDQVLTVSGWQLAVTREIDFETRKTTTAYNLTVADLNTYYVLAGATPILVHNSSCPTDLGNGTFRHSDGSIRDAQGHFAGSTGARVGASAEANVWDHLEVEGYTVVRRTVAVTGNGGQTRYYDGAIDVGGGNYLGIEVKSGGASRDAGQRAFDDWVSRGNVPIGIGQSKGFNIVGVFDAITP